MVFPAWCLQPKTLVLGEDEVHVWRAALNLSASSVQSLQQTLAPDEQRRAERFHFRKDREHFIVAHGLLRIILGRYLDIKLSQLRFCYSPYGKPALAKESGGDALQFNLSHSHGMALYAVTRRRNIGVDIERVRTDWPSEQVAEQFFASSEVAQLRALPDNAWHEAFFRCWTRKEAYIKARGEGLSLPLDKFEVSLAPGEPAALLSTKGDPEEASRWSMKELRVGPGYAAALVVQGHDWQLICRQL
jgi:4'-phosphopantetheinyl transferase